MGDVVIRRVAVGKLRKDGGEIRYPISFLTSSLRAENAAHRESIRRRYYRGIGTAPELAEELQQTVRVDRMLDALELHCDADAVVCEELVSGRAEHFSSERDQRKP
jgi:hypothetical protein